MTNGAASGFDEEIGFGVLMLLSNSNQVLVREVKLLFSFAADGLPLFRPDLPKTCDYTGYCSDQDKYPLSLYFEYIANEECVEYSQ